MTCASAPAPFCGGECPSGIYQETEYTAGDGAPCRSGCKVFCCDDPPRAKGDDGMGMVIPRLVCMSNHVINIVPAAEKAGYLLVGQLFGL